MQKLRHEKKRTVGLVYEFLAREIAAATIDRDPTRAAAAMSIIERHLGPGTELHEELTLHRRVMESRGLGKEVARRIVDELKAAGLRLSTRPGRGPAKTALIHEMNRTFGRDVFDRHRIPDYVAHSSIGILLSRGLGSPLSEGVDLARVEQFLVEFISEPAVQPRRYDPDATLHAYKIAVGLFQEEYGRDLTPDQSSLLREHVRVSLGGNPAPLLRTVERQRADLQVRLRAARADEAFKKDPEMAARLDEAIALLGSLATDDMDATVESLMMFHNLKTEIES